jgi:hypothetical protein
MKKLLLYFLTIICQFSYAQVWTLADANFESTTGPMTFSSNGNMIWQIGLPAKPFFDTAFSAPNAIMTDTANPYPVNNVSSIILRNVDSAAFNTVHGINTLTFMHKYQTTPYLDGCAVEVSYDGNGWQSFLEDTFWRNNSDPGTSGQLYPNNFGMYSIADTLFNGEPGFSGTSNGWVIGHIQWIWMIFVAQPVNLPYPDSMFIRFTFYSDSIADSLDGWLIDNITLTGQDPSGISETLFQTSAIGLYPQPADEKVNVVLRKEIAGEAYSIYDIAGRKVAAGKAVSNFSIDVNKIPAGIYQLVIETAENNFLVKPLAIAR